MKSIMISIKPQWVEKILNGEKTIEIRKTMPKCKLPCKVYIYCTKGKYEIFNTLHGIEHKGIHTGYLLNGKVVAEFTLNKVDEFEFELWDKDTYESIGKVYYDEETGEREIDVFESDADIETTEFANKSKLSLEDLRKYLGTGISTCFAWHIESLKIYDKSKELSEFRKDLDCDDYPCNKNRDCKYNYYDYSEGCWACGIDFDGSNCIYKQLKRPPQSWCYVEEV